MNNKDLIKEFRSLKSDKDRWIWVREHQETGIIVMCDNDDTYIVFEDDELYASFDNYIGCSYGVFFLMEQLGIMAEQV